MKTQKKKLMEEAKKLKTIESGTKLKGDRGQRLPEGKFYIILLRAVFTIDHVEVVIRSIECYDLLKIMFPNPLTIRMETRLSFSSASNLKYQLCLFVFSLSIETRET